MLINSSTRLEELLDKYPFLRSQLPSVNLRFHALNSYAGKYMIKTSTIADMSRRSGMDEPRLISAISNLIERAM